MRVVELIVVIFVGIMSVVLVIEMALLGVNVPELLNGWVYGFTETTSADLFSVTGIVGCVVMPHNLYLYSATCQSRPVQRDEATVRLAVQLSSWEPALPVLVSFFGNTAIVAIGAETVYGVLKIQELLIFVITCHVREPQPVCCLVLPWSRPDKVVQSRRPIPVNTSWMVFWTFVFLFGHEPC
mmetsp:Transcript_49605/g.50431  ORF Transcript_49605/g.50431 Transcript_49605/m.50431 type:complete len:183 (-) Transcript_49605:662-1210(-)